MAAATEGFFRRWAARKEEVRRREEVSGREAEAAAAPDELSASPAGEAILDLPDPATLGVDADFSAYLRRGVPPALRRAALRRLTHLSAFNTPDGLDIHMEDYNLLPALPEEMRAAALQVAGLVWNEQTGRAEPKAAPVADEPAGEDASLPGPDSGR